MVSFEEKNAKSLKIPNAVRIEQPNSNYRKVLHNRFHLRGYTLIRISSKVLNHLYNTISHHYMKVLLHSFRIFARRLIQKCENDITWHICLQIKDFSFLHFYHFNFWRFVWSILSTLITSFHEYPTYTTSIEPKSPGNCTLYSSFADKDVAKQALIQNKIHLCTELIIYWVKQVTCWLINRLWVFARS